MAWVTIDDWQARSLRHGRSAFGGAVAAVVAGVLLAFLVSQARLMPWGLIASIAPAPANQVLNAAIGPKMLRLLAAEALGFTVVVGGATLVFASARVRAIFGNGSLVVFRRAIGLAWMPVLAAAYLLTRAGPDRWIITISVHADYIDLTVPTLVGVVLFGIAALALAPTPSGRFLPLPLEIVADVAPVILAIGVVLSLDQDVGPVARPWNTYLGNVVIVQLTLATAEIVYVLTATEAALADWRDLRGIWVKHLPRQIPPSAAFGPLPPRLRAAAADAARRARNAARVVAAATWIGPAAARLAVRAAIFTLPVLVGIWVALGYQLSYASPILDRNGQVLEYYHAGQPLRLYVAPNQISPNLYEALDATEDPGIYVSPETHSPINPVRVAGIFTAAASAGALSGGSGIATQSCKNLVGRSLADDVWSLPDWLPLKRQTAMMVTLAQKLAFEFPCGWAFERTALFTRPRGWIVAFYLNQIYFGQGVYGAEAAARTYFNATPSALTPDQAALLAGLPQAPSYYDPWANPGVVKDRRSIVIHSMLREGYLTPSEAQALDVAPLAVASAPVDFPTRATDFVHDGVTDWLDQNNFGGLSTDGLTVTTTLDLSAQAELQADLTGVVGALSSRGVDAGAAMIVDPRTGEVRAWVGSNQSDDQTATNQLVGGIPHQVGSAIKPLLYSCALTEGKLKPNDKIDDTQRVIGGKYVANWDLQSHGILTAREALAQSSNVAAAELTDRLTPVGFADCLHDTFQVQANLDPDQYGVFLGLGLAPIPMEQVAGAYTVLATGGTYHPILPVSAVQSRDGQTIYQVPLDPGQVVLDCGTTLWVTQAMEDVSQIIGLPPRLATKTGTTPSSSFAAGFGQGALVLAWVGNLSQNGVQLATEDVFGKDGGGQVWKDWALKHDLAPGSAALSSCPSA